MQFLPVLTGLGGQLNTHPPSLLSGALRVRGVVLFFLSVPTLCVAFQNSYPTPQSCLDGVLFIGKKHFASLSPR
jgi:hypothetical protein